MHIYKRIKYVCVQIVRKIKKYVRKLRQQQLTKKQIQRSHAEAKDHHKKAAAKANYYQNRHAARLIKLKSLAEGLFKDRKSPHAK